MGRRFAELAFTPLVKEQQKQHGSRHLYERVERSNDLGDSLGPFERSFIEASDGFYMASVTETGWPYIQYRGGLKGFLHIEVRHESNRPQRLPLLLQRPSRGLSNSPRREDKQITQRECNTKLPE